MNNKSNVIKSVLILVCVALTLTGVSLFGIIKSDENLEENTVIELNGETSKTLKAELRGFYPGCEKEYTISLKGVSASSYLITLGFTDDEKSGELENFITVRITADDKTVEKSLIELLNGEIIELGRNANDLKITYLMPESVGNEAQGTTATFYVEICVKNA